MERENDGGPDNKAARNVTSALIYEANPLENPVPCARTAFFRSLLEKVKRVAPLLPLPGRVIE